LDRFTLLTIALSLLGIVLILVGWHMQLNGVEFEVCKSYVVQYKSFEGFVNTTKMLTEYRYEVPLSISDFELATNTVKSFEFEVNESLGFIHIKIWGLPADLNYRGYVRVLDENGSEVLSTWFTQFNSIDRDRMNVTLAFMKSLDPGHYRIELALNTSAHIHLLQLYGISSRDIAASGIAITLTPSNYETIEIVYPCRITFRNMITATALITAGLIATTIAAILATVLVHKSSRTVAATKVRKRR